MQIFNLTLTQMLMIFTLIVIGFILRKTKVLPENAYISLSKLETYVLVPAVVLNNQLRNCTVETFRENSVLILYGLCTVVVAVLLSYPLSALFVPGSKGDPERSYVRNVYKYALTFGNYGLLGNFVVLGVWGDQAFYRYSLFTMTLSFFVYGWGVLILIPKGKGDGMLKTLKKGLLAPSMISLFVGVAGGLLGLGKYVPEFAMKVLSNAAGCMGPVAMLIAGLVIGGFDIKQFLSDKKIYIASFVRLILIPAAFLTVLKLIGARQEVLIPALIAYGTPMGLNTVIFPASYGGETKTGASMALISNTLAVATIPLMYLVFIELW